MVGPMAALCLQLQRYVLNGVEMKILLHPTTTPFRLMSVILTPAYNIIITDVYLMVCHIYPAPAIVLAHEESLKTPRALSHYSYMNEEIRQFTVAKGLYMMEVDDTFLGSCPTTMCIGIVRSKH